MEESIFVTRGKLQGTSGTIGDDRSITDYPIMLTCINRLPRSVQTADAGKRENNIKKKPQDLRKRNDACVCVCVCDAEEKKSPSKCEKKLSARAKIAKKEN
jgi:hypothetical protein